MALHLSASLGMSSSQGIRMPASSPSSAPNSSRARPSVTCQATFGAPKPGSHRVREQSPSKVQALAAPALEREVAAVAPTSLPQHATAASSNILEVCRADLERLLLREAPPAYEEVECEQHELQQQQQPAAVAAAAAAESPEASAVLKRQQRSAAVSTSGPQQQQRRRRALLVSSTRRARNVAAAAADAAATPVATSRETATQQAAAAVRKSAATSAALSSWLLDCSSRRQRGAKQPLAAHEGHGESATPQDRGRRSDSTAPRLEAAALNGLAEETKEDMLVLINTRAVLRTGRRMKSSSRAAHSSGADVSIMSSYVRNLGNTAVLSRQQEARLAAILQKGLALGKLAEQLAAHDGRSPADVSPDALAAAAGLPSGSDVAQRMSNQREAKDLLMQYNVRLVINIAKRYVGNGIEIMDLIPEGMVGLSKSLDRFDASKGFKFSTYAHWWIRQSISRAVCDQARVVRLPSHVCETLYRINRAVTAIEEQSDRDELPSYEEIAAAVGLPVRRVIQYLRLSNLPSGDRPTSYLSGSSFKEVAYEVPEDCIENEDLGEEGQEEGGQYESIHQMTDLLLSTLEKRERNILRLRYGLLGWGAPGSGSAAAEWGSDTDGGSMSLGEVASAYGLSKERIRQIEDKAMRALRKPWRQQLAQEIAYGKPISASNLSHLASAQQLAAEEGSWSL